MTNPFIALFELSPVHTCRHLSATYVADNNVCQRPVIKTRWTGAC